MRFVAKALYIPYSPYKLRPLADVVRGKPLAFALGWLQSYKSRRTLPLRKVIESAAANALNLKKIGPQELIVREILVDQGPVFRYFKPGAMGRAMPQRRRLCHIRVALETQINNPKEVESGTES